MELGPLSIMKWDAGEKNGEIGQFQAELVFWLSCKISFFTISNHTNGAAEAGLETYHNDGINKSCANKSCNLLSLSSHSQSGIM